MMKLAITMGDPAGIGAEIIVKALAHDEIYANGCVPIVIGDKRAMEEAIAFTGSAMKLHVLTSVEEAVLDKSAIHLLDPGCLTEEKIEYGTVKAAYGNAAYGYIEKAIQMALKHEVEAVATAPLCKESLQLAGHHYAGHTEIFAALTNTPQYSMLLCSGNLRVVHVTTHVALEDACKLITKERVLEVIRLAQIAARLMGVKQPTVGVAGLNPHCSENGLFGQQETEAIIPAVEDAKREGIQVEGPIPPDTIFVKALSGQYDVVVAMYHDQGHIPLKLVGFRLDTKTNRFTSMSGINCTIGLPFIRSSVDHGTAFDRAGKNISNEQSMVEAIEAAVVMTNNISIRKR